MLKKTLLLLLVVAGFATFAGIPAASAQRIPAAAHQIGKCPPGDNGSSNYCVHFCIVPRLVGGGLLTAFVKASLAGCRIGTIHIVNPAFAPKLTNANRGLFKVVAQSPAPGTFHRFDFPITIWVKFNKPA